MTARISHISRFLLKGTVSTPSVITIDGSGPKPLRAYPSPRDSDLTFYCFKPDGFRSGTQVSVRAADNTPGEDCRFEVNLIPAPDVEWRRQLCLGLNAAPDWAIDEVAVVGGQVTLLGWIMQQPGDSFEILVNGERAKVSFVERSDVNAVFAHLAPDRRWRGFTAESKFDPQADDLTFRLNNPQAMVYGFSLTADRSFPAPEADRIFRVNGTLSQAVFNRMGYSHFKIIAETCRALFPGREHPVNILDWGCGCGGLGRFFLQDRNFEYFGCDIDPDNLAWCNDNLAPGRFVQLPLVPPAKSPFQQCFDVIFGLSVISHLSPAHIKSWLIWLSSRLGHGGYLIVSTLSTQAISRLTPELAHAIVSQGYSFDVKTTDIGRLIGTEDYYGVAYQTPEFLAALVEPDLEISHHIPSALSQQDIFIFRRSA